ncbi:type II toxin-antitoxin system PemK/MazF family toxin, partial [Kocuria rosea]
MKLNLGTLTRLAARAVDAYQRSGRRRPEPSRPGRR